MNLSDLDDMIALKEKQEELERAKIDEIVRVSSLPLYLRIQQKGQEEAFERVKSCQKEAFKKKFKSLERFDEFWELFLSGQVKSISCFSV